MGRLGCSLMCLHLPWIECFQFNKACTFPTVINNGVFKCPCMSMKLVFHKIKLYINVNYSILYRELMLCQAAGINDFYYLGN